MVLLLLPLWFLAGLLGTNWSSLFVFASIAILFRWVQLDVAKRKSAFSWPLRIALVVLTIVALPSYFFKSRGWLGGCKVAAQASAIFVASMLCYRMGYAL